MTSLLVSSIRKGLSSGPEIVSADHVQLCNESLKSEMPSMNELSMTPQFDMQRLKKTTTLFVQINGHENLEARAMAEIITELYLELDQAMEGVQNLLIAEKRWDSFILVGKDMTTTQARETALADDAGVLSISGDDILGPMLIFAANLHAGLHANQALRRFDLTVAMGIASGTMTLIGGDSGSCWSARRALGVRDDAAHIAQAMAGLGVPATVLVHESALWRWAAATRRLPPAAACIRLESGEQHRAAIFDVHRRRFRSPYDAK